MVRLIILFLMPYSIYASILASLNSESVELGDMATYSINLSGKDISRPNIQRLCDTDVISTSSRTSINVINGEIQKSYILSYKFIPQKSCVIKPIPIEIDGKVEYTNEVKVKVVQPSGAKSKDFVLELISDKKELFVGETFHVSLIFKQKVGSRAIDSEFIPPKLKGFWVKDETSPQRYRQNGYDISKVIYTLAPQREGKLTIDRAQIRIAFRHMARDSWGAFIAQIKWKSYFSNELTLDVKPLPNGVDLVGDFKIDAVVDRISIDSNEAVNVTLSVVGDGNLEDIKSFKPQLENVNVFDEKIKIDGNKLTQKLAFVSDSDFTIPPFTLKYFDLKTKEIKTISTNPIDIKVKNAKVKEKPLVIKKAKESKNDVDSIKTVSASSDDKFSLIFIVEGFVVGLVLGWFLGYFKVFKFPKGEKKVHIIKDEKLLLIKLMPYKDNDDEVKTVVDTIEHNLYSADKKPLDKKLIKELIGRYNIS